jgi:hypothetical protein
MLYSTRVVLAMSASPSDAATGVGTIPDPIEG